jgi:hypothetical protein
MLPSQKARSSGRRREPNRLAHFRTGIAIFMGGCGLPTGPIRAQRAGRYVAGHAVEGRSRP